MGKANVLGNDPFKRGAAVREAAATIGVGDATAPVAVSADAKAAVHEAPPPAAPKKARKPRAHSVPAQARPRKGRQAAPGAARPEARRPEVVPVEPPASAPSRLEDLERSLMGRATIAPAVRRAFSALASSPALGRAMARGLEVLAAASKAATASPVAGAVRALLPAAQTVAVRTERASGMMAAALSAAEAVRRLATVSSVPGEVDEFGEDASVVERAVPALDFLYDHYWRVRVEGVDRLPVGPYVVVANHSGALPFDGPMMRTVLRREGNRPEARWLIEDAIAHAPFVGVYLARLGAVRACPENAEQLLARGAPVIVFPEGVHGMGKITVPWFGGERYRVGRFGRGGFVKLALRAKVPVVPVAIMGAEESSPLVAKIPARSLGIPYIPVTPTFPLMGPLGLVPFPSRWTVRILSPVILPADGALTEADQAKVQAMAEEIRLSVQTALDAMRAERRPRA